MSVKQWNKRKQSEFLVYFQNEIPYYTDKCKFKMELKEYGCKSTFMTGDDAIREILRLMDDGIEENVRFFKNTLKNHMRCYTKTTFWDIIRDYRHDLRKLVHFAEHANFNIDISDYGETMNRARCFVLQKMLREIDEECGMHPAKWNKNYYNIKDLKI